MANSQKNYGNHIIGVGTHIPIFRETRLKAPRPGDTVRITHNIHVDLTHTDKNEIDVPVVITLQFD